MQFTSNHDENSWNGTVWERLDGGVKTFAVLAATVPGMPLIYNGQEAGLDKRLKFFEKDPIRWGEHELFDFYIKLLDLKKRNKALWNGKYGGDLTRVTTTENRAVYAFIRERENNKVFVILNLTSEPKSITLKGSKYTGEYRNIFTGEMERFRKNTDLYLKPWDYLVYEITNL